MLFREYPTKKRYSWTGESSRKANFDMAIMDPSDARRKGLPMNRKSFPKIKLAAAVEVKLDVTDKRWGKEMNKCRDKLLEVQNEKGRFILFFARRARFKFLDCFKDWASRNDVQVRYVRVHPKKWRTDYCDKWL